MPSALSCRRGTRSTVRHTTLFLAERLTSRKLSPFGYLLFFFLFLFSLACHAVILRFSSFESSDPSRDLTSEKDWLCLVWHSKRHAPDRTIPEAARDLDLDICKNEQTLDRAR